MAGKLPRKRQLIRIGIRKERRSDCELISGRDWEVARQEALRNRDCEERRVVVFPHSSNRYTLPQSTTEDLPGLATHVLDDLWDVFDEHLREISVATRHKAVDIALGWK
jgi:hypothetical protein